MIRWKAEFFVLFQTLRQKLLLGRKTKKWEKKPLWVGTISITLFGYWLIVTSIMRALFVLIVPHLLQIPYEIIFTSGEGKQELGRKSKARLRDGTISITLVKLFCFPFSRLLLHPYEPRIIFFLGFAGWLLPLCLKLRKFSVVSFLLFFPLWSLRRSKSGTRGLDEQAEGGAPEMDQSLEIFAVPHSNLLAGEALQPWWWTTLDVGKGDGL